MTMERLYGILADIVVLLHAAFIVFAVFGGFLVFRWRRAAWVHLPTALWAVLVELSGWICPLTPLENLFRHLAGEMVYHSGFIEHYLMPAIYPHALTRELQLVLGLMVLCINVAIYGWVWFRAKKQRAVHGFRQ